MTPPSRQKIDQVASDPPESAKPSAYSYLRMSTAEQLKGDSARRQMKASEQFAKEKGLHLVDTMADIGISAYRGRNLEFGALKWFLAKLQNNEIPKGSYFIVESMDRLSRQNAVSAFALLNEIIAHGVTLVTLDDRQEYSAEGFENTQYQLFIALGAMIRAHGESKRKSELLSAVWGEKKRQAREGHVSTRQMPAWLKLNEKTKEIEPIHERAEIVRNVFQMARDGFGAYSIARRLNDEELPTWGPRRKSNAPQVWRESYIRKILYNRSVLGEYQPHRIEHGRYSQRDRLPEGEPILNYYPRVVDDALFYQAQSAVQSRRKNSAGRKGKAFSNLFTGLLRCGRCGGGYRFFSKGPLPKGGNYLQCSVALVRGSCQAKAFRYEPFEEALLNLIYDLDVDRLLTKPGLESSGAGLRQKIANLEAEKANLDRAIKNIMDVIQVAQYSPKELGQSLSDAGRKRDAKAAELEIARQTLAQTLETSPEQRNALMQKLFKALSETNNETERENVRRLVSAELRGLFASITITNAMHQWHELIDERDDWKRHYQVQSEKALKTKIDTIGFEVRLKYRSGENAIIDLLERDVLRLKTHRKMRDWETINSLPDL